MPKKDVWKLHCILQGSNLNGPDELKMCTCTLTLYVTGFRNYHKVVDIITLIFDLRSSFIKEIVLGLSIWSAIYLYLFWDILTSSLQYLVYGLQYLCIWSVLEIWISLLWRKYKFYDRRGGFMLHASASL